MDRDLAASATPESTTRDPLAVPACRGGREGLEAPRRGHEVAHPGPPRRRASRPAQPSSFTRSCVRSSGLAGGDQDHLLDEVDAGDQLGYRVLDLQPRVHLEEIEALVLPRDELDGAGRIVADRLGQRDGLLAHFPPRRLVEQRRGGLLDDLLVAALDRAFAPSAEVEAGAVLVAQHLDFDVARVLDEFLDEDAVVAERGLGLRARALEALRHLVGRIGDAHALAAATGGGLDHYRIADLVGDADRLVAVGDLAEMAPAPSRRRPRRRASSR